MAFSLSSACGDQETRVGVRVCLLLDTASTLLAARRATGDTAESKTVMIEGVVDPGVLVSTGLGDAEARASSQASLPVHSEPERWLCQVGDDEVGCTVCDRSGRCIRVGAQVDGHHRCVCDAKHVNAFHPKIWCQNCDRVIFLAHRAGAHGMVAGFHRTPAMVREILIATGIRTGQNFVISLSDQNLRVQYVSRKFQSRDFKRQIAGVTQEIGWMTGR